MDPVSCDLETIPFEPAYMAPAIVCASTYHPQDGLRLWATDQLWGMFDRILTEPAPVLGHGFAYDSCCILQHAPEPIRKLLWDKYERDQVVDSIPTERIIEISTGVRGRLKLDLLAARYGVEVTKSPVQTDFGRYYGRPISEYTREHRRYLGGDSAELWRLYKRQRGRGIASDKDIAELTRGDLWLRLMSNYGIRTDPARVAKLETETQAEVDDLTKIAQGFAPDGSDVPDFPRMMRRERTRAQVRDGKWFSRDMNVIKALVLEAYGAEGVPRTDGWNDAKRAGKLAEKLADDPLFGIGTSKEVLEESGDPRLEAIADLAEYLSVRNKDVKMLKAGVDAPIHARFSWGAATTRGTCSAPNLQNFRRKAGIRECLVPRPGCCFIETDYPSLELFAVAQVCAWKLKRFDLVGHMNHGRDYHAVLAAEILGTTYEDVMARKGKDPQVDNTRVGAKNGNYGLLGYMTNPDTFAWYVNHQSRSEKNPRGLGWTREDAIKTMKLWRRNAHDPVAFLNYVDTLRNGQGLYDVQIPGTGIVRRGCTRTAGANTHFQGLGAVIARRAGWKIAKAQYITREMPSRTVDFIHDAFLAECKLEVRNTVAALQEKYMAEALTEVCPDMHIVPILDAIRKGLKPGRDCMAIDSAGMDHYSKNAHSAYDKNGDLVVCEV
jgi:DNA polymerase family A